MQNLDDGFSAVASVVSAIVIDKSIFSVGQIGIGGDGDDSNLGFGSKEFSGWDEWW